MDLLKSCLFCDVNLFAVQLVMGQTSLASVPISLFLADRLASVYHSLGNLLPQRAVPLASFLAPNIILIYRQLDRAPGRGVTLAGVTGVTIAPTKYN